MADPSDPVHAELTDRLQSALEEIEQLNSALESRHDIGVAQGMLMLRYGISVDAAFDFLVRRSQDSNTKLRDIAGGIVKELMASGWPSPPTDVPSTEPHAPG